MIHRRWFAPTLLALVALGGGIFLATSRSWATGQLRTEGLPTDVVEVTGADAYPVVAAMALVIAAAGIAVLSTRGRLRQLVGLIIVVAAVVVVAVIWTGSGQLEAAFSAAVEQSTAFTGTEPELQRSSWPVVVTLMAVLAGALGMLTLVSSATWPAMSGRYDAPQADESRKQLDVDDATGSELWKSIDEGHDPTA